MASEHMLFIDGISFNAKQKGISFLKTSGAGSIGNAANANIRDSAKDKNIFPFGNCLAELSGAEKAMLKVDSRAKAEGICSNLMRLCGTWDNLPVTGEKGYFSYYGA